MACTAPFWASSFSDHEVKPKVLAAVSPLGAPPPEASGAQAARAVAPRVDSPSIRRASLRFIVVMVSPGRGVRVSP
ncbi:hypothetical protein ACFQGX_22380 [Nonomuraea dietziae]|uniref:hypothetical protein n=1 Tax=Nonomuraea dietziae TaxID=65515 RepID=UPI00361AA8D9